MTKLLANPFFVYIISFAIVIAIYSLGWSTFYPTLSWPVLGFFIATFIASFIFGVITHVFKKIEYRKIAWSNTTSLYLFLVWAGYALEFVYNKGIPLQMLLQGVTYDYTLFGIPTFHVFLVTFSSFLSVFIFHQLCSEFTAKRVFYYLMSILPPILIINRGMIIIILTSCLFVFLLSLRSIGAKTILGIVLSILVVFYLFGIMGNLRQTRGKSTSSEIIINNSHASDSFRKSSIPHPYIWSYLYISSPLANLQNTINNASVSTGSLGGFINFELLPDFISKRTAKIFELERRFPILVRGWLTVATLYAPSYMYLGWTGIVLMFCFYLATTFTYIFVLKKSSKYYVTGLAILNTLVLFNTFDNMYYFSGVNLQLVYPLILSMLSSLNMKNILTRLNPKFHG